MLENILDYFQIKVSDDYYYQLDSEKVRDKKAFLEWLHPHRSQDYLDIPHSDTSLRLGVSRLTKMIDEFLLNTILPDLKRHNFCQGFGGDDDAEEDISIYESWI